MYAFLLVVRLCGIGDVTRCLDIQVVITQLDPCLYPEWTRILQLPGSYHLQTPHTLAVEGDMGDFQGLKDLHSGIPFSEIIEMIEKMKKILLLAM